MSFKEFVKELGSNGVRGDILKTIFYSLLTSSIFIGILYFFKLKDSPDFLSLYGFYLFFSVLGYALIIATVRQVRVYEGFPCMSGMMIGMTVGMIAGFLSGFFIGATNGMFWGSVFGMSVGMYFGVVTGNSCGIMGVMEGLMAGFMGGLMGAMTAIMMYNDNLQAAAVIVFCICAVILGSLMYMIYIETRNEKQGKIDGIFYTLLWSFILTSVTLWFMVFGPKSPLFGGYNG